MLHVIVLLKGKYFTLTSKLWGSSFDGSQTSSHSVAHPLQNNNKQQAYMTINSLLTHDKFSFCF